MKDFTKQSLKLIEEVQKELLDVEELIHPREIEDVDIKKLIRPSYSSRVVIPNLLKTLVKSLYENNFVGGIFISKDLNVIDGWHRVEIWEAMGNETIPCHILDIPKPLERKLHLSLNRPISEFNLEDFGISSHFNDLDLVRDFGFTKADLLDEEIETEIVSDEAEKLNPNSRLTASIPVEYHAKLDEIKKELELKNKSLVLIKLIDFYEDNRC